MGAGTTRGPAGTDVYGTPGVCSIDDGTMVRQPSPTPLTLGAGNAVAMMAIEDRFIAVLKRTVPLLPHEMQDEFAKMLTPLNLGIMAGTLAVWAGAHYFGVGFVADVLLLGVGLVFLGVQVFSAAKDFVNFVRYTADAKTQSDLDVAARYLARFIAVVGITAFMSLIFKGAKKAAPKVKALSLSAITKLSGMTQRHFAVFQQAAKDTGYIIAVRNTNSVSTPWIERGFPPKPIDIKMKTSPETGFATAADAGEAAAARAKGFFVIDPDGVPRNAAGDAMKFTSPPEWPVRPGQIVHPTQNKPLVGDYDLMGVIDPSAKGRNLSLAASKGELLPDWSNPLVRKVADFVNARLDQPRVLHGANEAGFGIPKKGGSTVFFPDGSVKALETPEEVAAFYRSIGRGVNVDHPLNQ